VQSNAVKATGMEYTDENDQGDRKQRPRPATIPRLTGSCSGSVDCLMRHSVFLSPCT
jgi:hypothetical protein